MSTLEETAPAFVEMAHSVVWATVASVSEDRRPRTRILHPFWEWSGGELVGWIATGPTPVKAADLSANPWMSCNYWSPSHDTCTADCTVEWRLDDETRERVWNLFAEGPEPVGYDPSIIPGWDSPRSEGFAALRLEPYRLRVFPGRVLLGQGGEVLHWKR
jgi:hypothetical protein